MNSEHKLPSWVNSKQRGFFKNEIVQKLGPQNTAFTSWLSTWRPVDENSKINFSYLKKNDDEIVSKSKAFEIGDYSTQKKCIICNKMFLVSAWVCYTYKFKNDLTKEKIYNSRHLACVYHFHCKGVFNEKKLKYENKYEESDDFDEMEFTSFSEEI